MIIPTTWDNFIQKFAIDMAVTASFTIIKKPTYDSYSREATLSSPQGEKTNLPLFHCYEDKVKS